MDARAIASEKIGHAAAALLTRGLASLCTWGPDCERVHDIFDEVEVERNLDRETDDVIMTTWHAKDTLEEALRYFVHVAFPADGYLKECRDWIVAPIASREWEKEIRRAMRDTVGES